MPEAVETDVFSRLDRLPWMRFHVLVVVSLGVTWVLDGLEVTVVSAVGSVLEEPGTLGLSASDVGLAGSAYIAGAILGALFFGRLADRHGRKRLFVATLVLYVLASGATAASTGLASFIAFRFATGTAIGGEYAAINSAIDELIPARYRGTVDLAINGSYWLGTAAGAVVASFLMNPRVLGHALGWRAAFALGVLLAPAIIAVRRHIPESPRWLVVRGRHDEAEAIVGSIEASAPPPVDQEKPRSMRIVGDQEHGLLRVAEVIFVRYRRRAILGLSLMIAQAFFYNAIFFTYALTLTKFYGVLPERVGRYLVPFAIGNFLGPLVLGRLFDTVGRRAMIAVTYGASGVLLLATGLWFEQGMLTAASHTAMWAACFFFASAAASSAYLTVSEVFPIEIRALSIALFYAVGTGTGGLLAPFLFGELIQSGSRRAVFAGYALGAFMMLGAAAVGWFLGVRAEGRSLEDIARPLSADDEDAHAPLAGRGRRT